MLQTLRVTDRQTDRMNVELLCLTVALLSSPLLTLCDPLFVLSAPNLLRVGSSENVFVEAQDYHGGDLKVKIVVKDFPGKNIDMLSKPVTLTKTQNFQLLTDIKIPDDKNYFIDDPLEKQYVYLQAQFPSQTLEKVVMVSFQSGYIFVQTDKPIYTPAGIVLYRIFSLTPNLQPLNDSAISLEIMNPQGITISKENIYPTQGMKSGNYKLPEVASTGIWKVVTRYAKTPQKNFTAEFEVKEYVLPTFEVTLTLSKSFFYVGDESLTVDIIAKYLFGQMVDGQAFVVFGVMDDERKLSIPASLRTVPIVKGEGTADLTREMILQTFTDINQLIGKSIYVSVSVLTETGSEMVEAQRRGIQIVTSPYTIHFKRTPQFFKPGMPFDVSVYVTNPDQTPAKNVEVEVNPGEIRGQTEANGIAKVTINSLEGSSTLDITVKTRDRHLEDKQQAEKKMTAQAYTPKGGSKNYLHIGIDAAEFKIKDQRKVNLNMGKDSKVKDHDYTYMIISKGQIVKVGRFERKDQPLVTLPLHITKEMLPSFRFVAYYHVGSSEVVSDSVWVDVKDTCMGTLELKVKDQNNQQGYKSPGDEFSLHITGDPGAKVGLVVVDKAVHVLNKNRLTQSKIWDVIEKHDTGCTAGSGKDSMGVFYDAGLMFESNTAGGTNIRTMNECPAPPKRRRRSESLMHVTTTLAGKYSGDEKKCCVDGMRENKLGYTCERRATYIEDGKKCVEAFLHCCNEIKTNKEKAGEAEMVLARSDEDDDYFINSDEIVSRVNFPESWHWEEVTLPPCKTKNCETSLLKKDKIFLQESITTWQILAISLSNTNSICVADPQEIVVSKKFFIDLKMPYSAVRNEQLEIKAVLHNYTPQKMKVRVDFIETENVCSSASNKGKYRTVVEVDRFSTRSVSYVIIPMKLGNHQIEVKAAAFEFSDGVKKPLMVVSEGILRELEQENVELNPVKMGGEQHEYIRSAIPKDQVPDTPASVLIAVTGEEIAQTVEQAISGDFMGRLIIQPDGCGEQNMMHMTLPLIATHYLDRTNQWDAVGMERRNEAVNHINTGYQRELKYRKSDGSYSAWEGRQSSTWLTAYVAKVFAMANDFVAIQENVLCSALRWMILNKQLPDGSFKEDKPIFTKGMDGDVQGSDGDASLTAFVLIAMQEGSELCVETVGSLPESMRKALGYLEGRLHQLTNPYAVAMTSYAMANAEKLNKDLLIKHSTKQNDGTAWIVPGQHYHSLEATAYAVLALVRAKEYDKAGEAVHWLARQQSHYGGSGTTQATIMVFQAVAEYRTQVKSTKNFNLDVELSIAGRSGAVKWTFKKENVNVPRSDKVKLRQDFNVTARGTGTATLSVLTLYYAKPAEKISDCKHFDLSVQIERQREVSYEGAIESYNFTMEFFYRNTTSDATMTILDVGLLTGFIVDERDLTELAAGKDRYIQKYEKDQKLSERGSLLIYLEKVSHTQMERIVFRMHKINKVGLLQPARVTVYEYYSPDVRCTKYYHPEREDGALIRLCQGDVCQCAEENCSYQIKNKVKEEDRFDKACEPGMEYVYKVKVESMDLTMHTDTYKMKVVQVLKEGNDPGVEGKERFFLSHPSCRKSLGFQEGNMYLIMGKFLDIPQQGERLQYILGEQTWIEYWPTREESQTEKYKAKYIGLSQLTNDLTRTGCTT